VSDKLGMPMSEFSKSNIQERLKSLNVNDLNIEKFIKILNDCEFALFAGRDTDSSANAIYEQAAGVITDIENDLKLSEKSTQI
jgi:hypothetical protein